MFFVQVLVFALALHLAAVIGDSSLSDRNLLTLNLKIQSGDDLDEDNQAQFLLDGKKCCSCPSDTTLTQPATTTPTINAIGSIATTTTATTATSTTTTSTTTTSTTTTSTTTTSTTTTSPTTTTTTTTTRTTTYVSPYKTVVTFIAGGGQGASTIISDVEIYSPGGQCSRRLASLPMPLCDPAATFYNGQIIVCGGLLPSITVSKACWSYSATSNSWVSFLPAMQYTHLRMPSVTYENKFYVLNDGNGNEAFDFLLQKWVPWKAITTSAGAGSCMVIWKDSFIVFGGEAYPRGVQVYNVTSDNWNTMKPMPQARAYMGCIALPSNSGQFLIVGSQISDGKTAHIYDAKVDSWTPTAPTSFVRWGPGMVNMNDRIFALGVYTGNGLITQTVEEYHAANNSWTLVQAPLLVPQRHFQPLVIPASYFAPYVSGGCNGI